MPRFFAADTSPAALANGNAIAGLVPAAAVGCRAARLILGCSNAGGTVSDFQIAVGVNRATARGTATTTRTGVKSDPDSGSSGITGVDSVYSVQPTLAATDAMIVTFNSRGGADIPLGPTDLVTTVGTANAIVLVNRSGATIPASHSVTWTIEWDE